MNTSAQALDSIQPCVSGLERTVLDAVRSAGPEGLTRDGISAETGMLIQTVCGRVLHLIQLNLIVELERTRKTRSGRNAAVLVAISQMEQLELL